MIQVLEMHRPFSLCVLTSFLLSKRDDLSIYLFAHANSNSLGNLKLRLSALLPWPTALSARPRWDHAPTKSSKHTTRSSKRLIPNQHCRYL